MFQARIVAALMALATGPLSVAKMVHGMAKKFSGRLGKLLEADISPRQHGDKHNGARGRRGKYKGRLHARQGARKRGSGRTARKIKAKARRAA